MGEADLALAGQVPADLAVEAWLVAEDGGASVPQVALAGQALAGEAASVVALEA